MLRVQTNLSTLSAKSNTPNLTLVFISSLEYPIGEPHARGNAWMHGSKDWSDGLTAEVHTSRDDLIALRMEAVPLKILAKRRQNLLAHSERHKSLFSRSRFGRQNPIAFFRSKISGISD